MLAVTNGWIVPFSGIMHCEALQIFTKGMKGEEGSRIRGGALGLGLLLGAATFAFALEQGCHKAEILAINDYGSALWLIISLLQRKDVIAKLQYTHLRRYA